MKITALIVAAGKGRRMGSAVGKQFLPLGGRFLACSRRPPGHFSGEFLVFVVLTPQASVFVYS